MSLWMWVVAYFVVALIVAGLLVKDINSVDDVGESSIAGIFWPFVIALFAYLYTVAGIATLRDNLLKYLRSKK